MGKKYNRQEVVKMIISSQELGKQEELITELARVGINVTQATLSRDLKQLRIVKAQNHEGRYVYMLPTSRVFRSVSDTHMTVKALHNMGVLSIKFSNNIAVVKTLPGYANHVAYDIDHAQLDIVLGTVAGDDTVFCVLDENTDHSHALHALSGVTNFNMEE